MTSLVLNNRALIRAFKSVQSDQGLLYLLTNSPNTTECMNGEQRPGWYFVNVQDDLNLCILHMLEGTFLLARTIYQFIVMLPKSVEYFLFLHDKMLQALIREPTTFEFV